jgi:hypothetical protein
MANLIEPIQRANGGIIATIGEEPPPDDIEMTEDGGAIAKIASEESDEAADQVAGFYDNIAGQFQETTLSSMATRLLEQVDRDKEARKDRDKAYAEAQKRTGLGKEAPGGAQFQGASRVVHPMLLEACLDFASRAIRELMPPNGPVKMFVPGENVEPERLRKAERKKNYMNWQCIFQMPEFRSELEQLLSQLPLGGAMYLRLIPDYSKRRRRPVPTFVPLDYVSIPAAASNYYTAERQCYWEPVTTDEFETRIREGMYRNIDSVPTSTPPEETESEKAAQKVEGKKIDPLNSDGQRNVCEISVYENLEPQYGIAPYLISIDHPSSKVVSITRNWEEEDPNYDRMQWMVEWIFFQWRGAQGIGLGQAIGSLAGAATGALRALLDSAHIQNIPTLARLKGANFSGQNETVNATQVIEIKGGVAGDADIRKLLMPIPFAGPSATLMELLGFLTDAGRQAIHVALDKLSEDNKNLPVGTTLALIEEGMKVMSAIHLRLFHSMSYFIRILHRINKMYLTEDELKNDVGEVLAQRSDFEGPLDCIPTADPEIFSDVQRIAQAQIIADRAAALPGVYDVRETEKFLLERAKIPNPDRFLVPKPTPEEMNQVNENVAMALGRPVTAFPLQDHLAHITVLVQAIMSPLFGQLPIVAPVFLPPALDHLKEHLVLWYANEFYELTRATLEVDEDGMTLIMKERDPETRKDLDRVLAAASNGILQREAAVFGVLPQVIQQAQTLIQQYTPQTLPSDPDKRAEVERKAKADQMKDQREKEKLGLTKENKILDFQSKAADRQAKSQLEFTKLSASEREVAIQEAQENARQAQELVARLQEIATQERAEDQRAAAELSSEERRNTQDNLTALRVAAAEIQSAEKVKVSTGTGANKNPSGGRPKG